jgi:hypothetical protein
MRAKTRVPVDLLKMDGTQLKGYVFAGSQERVLDLMNNREPFLPIELSGGQFAIMNKSVIQSITPSDRERMEGNVEEAHGSAIEAPPSWSGPESPGEG